MWVIFLLSAMVITLCLLVIIYIGNKIFIKMNNDWKENENRKGENEWELDARLKHGWVEVQGANTVVTK